MKRLKTHKIVKNHHTLTLALQVENSKLEKFWNITGNFLTDWVFFHFLENFRKFSRNILKIFRNISRMESFIEIFHKRFFFSKKFATLKSVLSLGCFSIQKWKILSFQYYNFQFANIWKNVSILDFKIVIITYRRGDGKMPQLHFVARTQISQLHLDARTQMSQLPIIKFYRRDD
jgi:hypothetical protein